MTKNINYITEQELKQLNKDLRDIFGCEKEEPDVDLSHNYLIEVSDGVKRFDLSYIAKPIKIRQNHTLEGISSYLLSCIANIKEGHPFLKLNETTAYFAAKYFLMKNGADFNGNNHQDISEEIQNISKEPDLKLAYERAKTFCEENIIKTKRVTPDYETFRRLVIKSIGIAEILSKK